MVAGALEAAAALEAAVGPSLPLPETAAADRLFRAARVESRVSSSSSFSSSIRLIIVGPF